jgi:hypothetical protein
MEIKSHQLLTDRMSLHYFELPKLPEHISREDRLNLWLALFKVKTEEELNRIQELEVPIMEQTIQAYRSITATSEFQTLERMRSDARRNEAAALRHATEVEREKWKGIVAEKEAVLAKKDAELVEIKAQMAKLLADGRAGT